jgi:hypothetical protein
VKTYSLPIDYTIQQLGSFLDAYRAFFPEYNITADNIGDRLMPNRLFQSNEGILSILNVTDFFLQQGAVVSGTSFDLPMLGKSFPKNSVNPVWRSALLNIVVGL